MRSHHAWRALPMLLLLLAVTVPLSTALAQDAGSILTVDTPDGQVVELGQDVTIRGWAGHQAGPGTGVDRVVILDAPQAAGGVAVAEAVYGAPRPDVGQAYGAAMTNSGYAATFKAAGSLGNKTVWVYAHSVANDGWTNKTLTLRYVAASAPAPAPAPAAVTTPSDTTNRYRNQNGLYGNTCDNQYGNQYNSGQYNQYGSQYGQYNQYGNQYNSGQYCDPYSSGYSSGSGLYGSGSYLNNQYPYLNNQYPYGNQLGGLYGGTNCALQSSGAVVLSYYNTGTGQYYSTYAQCIAAGTGGIGNCIQYSGGFYNTTTQQYSSTYAQCIASVTGGVGQCIQYTGGYYNSATGVAYSTYAQCAASITGGTGNCIQYTQGFYNTLTAQYYGTYDQCINQTTTGSNVVATVGADGTVTLYWTAVSTATEYRIYQVGATTTLIRTLAAGTTSTVINNLTAGSSVTFSVRALVNGVETVINATWTNNGSVVVVVAAPTNLATAASTRNSATLTWTPSATLNISSYQVLCSLNGVAGSFVAVGTTGQACTGATVALPVGASGAIVTGLTPSTTYYFQVTATVGTTVSSPSNTVTVATPA